MSKWGNKDLSTNTHSGQSYFVNSNKANSIVFANALFHNTTPSSFVNGAVVGIYGVTNTMVKIAANNTPNKVSTFSPGWILVKQGTGPVANLLVNFGGLGYTNTDIYTISGNSCINATFRPVTNTTGGILSFTSSNNGFGFPNTTYITKAFSNSIGGASLGSNSTITIVLGGRAGRTNKEVLKVVKHMISTSNTQLFPNA